MDRYTRSFYFKISRNLIGGDSKKLTVLYIARINNSTTYLLPRELNCTKRNKYNNIRDAFSFSGLYYTIVAVHDSNSSREKFVNRYLLVMCASYSYIYLPTIRIYTYILGTIYAEFSRAKKKKFLVLGMCGVLLRTREYIQHIYI